MRPLPSAGDRMLPLLLTQPSVESRGLHPHGYVGVICRAGHFWLRALQRFSGLRGGTIFGGRVKEHAAPAVFCTDQVSPSRGDITSPLSFGVTGQPGSLEKAFL